MQIRIRSNFEYPNRGTNDNLFKRLLKYISMFDKSWSYKIRPASNDSIKELKKISKFNRWSKAFPEDYEVFLKYMGENDGGLLSDSLRGTAKIRDIIGFYESSYKFSPDVFKVPCLPFFRGEMAGEFSFDLSKDIPYPILETERGEIFSIVAENFEKLLFQCAFKQYDRFQNFVEFSISPNDFDMARLFSEKKELFEVVEDIAKKSGLEKAWFNDEKHYIAFGIEANFYIENIGLNGIVGLISGYNRDFLKVISDDFIRELGAKLYFGY